MLRLSQKMFWLGESSFPVISLMAKIPAYLQLQMWNWYNVIATADNLQQVHVLCWFSYSRGVCTVPQVQAAAGECNMHQTGSRQQCKASFSRGLTIMCD